MLVYPLDVDVSSSALRFLTQQLRRHRRTIGSRWRRLSAGRQALLTLAHLRVGHTYAQLAAGFGIGTTTAYRYVTEAVELLAALAPGLADAVGTASVKAYLLLDGTLLPIDRIAADRPFYSGKHKKHGMNVQVIADPSGQLLWASRLVPVPQPAPARHARPEAEVLGQVLPLDPGVQHVQDPAQHVPVRQRLATWMPEPALTLR